ncbi:hypothetical protein K458DRAFT_353859 [Lentithecium fluviatile CBS 122367]|uniref:Uncharacterized protein n=1 Tax=Lentithecium fluviatile CBS 122367 TaxID=1168545 RepID=A0A6G1JN17_9PLEO|nr:hypothetical protein K458DRAFT_353859 [Lentithecium fluviatile CBS 122367]
MAAYSRGLYSAVHQHSLRFPSSIRTAIFTARPQVSLSHSPIRNFSSTIFRRYRAPSRYPSKSSTSSIINADPILRTVVQTREPVILYKEPSRGKYLLRVYSWATVATSIGLYSIYFAKHTSTLEQPFFVPPAYIVVGLAFVAIGIHIFQRPVRRISALEIVPGTMGGRVQLRVRARKTPWSKESIVMVDPFEATISEKTYPVVKELVEAERARRQSITEGLGHMFIVARVWEIAARFIEQKWTSFFLNFKFAVLQFGMIQLKVDGEKWKIDCEGRLLEDGKGIDRIIAEE